LYAKSQGQVAGQGKEVIQGRRWGSNWQRILQGTGGRELGLLVKLVSQRAIGKLRRFFAFPLFFFSGLGRTTKLIR